MPTLHGVGLSPFVRKVRIALAEKGIEYHHEPIVPFQLGEDYLVKSPLGKIPCWEEDDGYTLPDSSCILAYLEKLRPEPALYPSDARGLGRALWIEEYADTKLVGVCGTVFAQRIVRPNFMNEPTDEEAVRAALEDELPPILDYLEGQIGDRQFFVGDSLSVADLSVVSPLINLLMGGESVDSDRWPQIAGYFERHCKRASVAALLAEDQAFAP